MPDVRGQRPRTAGRSGQVLLAEDNPINQRVTEAMLEHLGFDVDVVADGADAVKAAMRTPYQAILMDCQLAGVDGYEATGEIRRLQGPLRRTPIVAVTASSSRSDEQRCLAAGMDDYLPKPLTLKALAAALARWVPEASRTAGAGADPPVLDALVVARLQQLGAAAGEDLVAQLATLFLADADTHLDALRQAIASGDAEALLRAAHTLGGASANLGASNLARLCAGLSTHTNGPPGQSDLFVAVERELGRVRSALETLVVAT